MSTHDVPPGLYGEPIEAPPQITEYGVESGAVHSRSQGWLPCVMITWTDEHGKEASGLMLAQDVLGFISDLREAMTASKLDVQSHVAEPGLGKTHERNIRPT